MPDLTRRTVLTGAGIGGISLATAGLPAYAAPLLLGQPAAAGTAPPADIHLTFGPDPAAEVVISWTTPSTVRRPAVRIGTPAGGYGRVVAAETTHYLDGASQRTVLVQHATVRGLRSDQRYVYQVLQGDAEPVGGTFRTAPAGRATFRFTSFGDQATAVAGDALWSPHAGDIVDQVEVADPLFHLVNGDLCYANLSPDRVQTWHDWFGTNARSMRNRPWMPTAGNHENELGNGPVGYAGYQAYFRLPGRQRDRELTGLWYAYTVGSVRFVHVNNDDVCYQDGGGSYVRGYSGGEQRHWLQRELASTRARHDVDWIVVCMHQAVISSADFNGSDRGIREEFVPLFDRYGVDLVVGGHEHHYERSHPVRGVVAGSATLTPRPVATGTTRIDTSAGTMYMILGGGGTSAPSNQTFYRPAAGKVITGVGPVGGNGKRPPIYVMEDAPWSALRDTEHSYGFAAFDVDPGTPGGDTTITVTYFDSLGSGAGNLVPFDTFTLYRPRHDQTH